MKTKHTPTPWILEETESQYSSDITIHGRYGTNKKYVCRVYGEGNLVKDCRERNANAAFIVKAVNFHEELIKWSKIVIEQLRKSDCLIAGVDGLYDVVAKAEVK